MRSTGTEAKDLCADDPVTDLQVQYSNYKNTLQQIAQKIGDVEQEAEEHKSVQFNSSYFRLFPHCLKLGADMSVSRWL